MHHIYVSDPAAANIRANVPINSAPSLLYSGTTFSASIEFISSLGILLLFISRYFRISLCRNLKYLLWPDQTSFFFNSLNDKIKTAIIIQALIRKVVLPIKLYKNPPKVNPTILARPPKLPATPCTAP